MLRIAHHAFPGSFHHSGKLATRDEGRGRSTLVNAARGHGIGEVHSHSFDPHNHFARLGYWFQDIADFEYFRPAGTGDDNSFHDWLPQRGKTRKARVGNARRNT